jgi:hypothetical protein
MNDGIDPRRGFVRTLLFGGVAALAVPAVWLGAAPWLGGFAALGLYLVGLTGAYLAWIAGSLRRGLVAGALGSAAAMVLLVLAAPYLILLAAGCAVVVAALRSGFLFRGPQPRLWVLEAVLLVAALAVAGALAAPGWLGVALAIWGWFLVQSVWFLLARPAPRRPGPAGDPFERARERLERLLDELEGGPV